MTVEDSPVSRHVRARPGHVRREMNPNPFYLLRTRSVGIYSPLYPADTAYQISRLPGRTNQSGEVVINGWLGTTGGIAEYADGEFTTFEAALAAIPSSFETECVIENNPRTWTVVSRMTAAARRRHERRVEAAHRVWVRQRERER